MVFCPAIFRIEKEYILLSLEIQHNLSMKKEQYHILLTIKTDREGLGVMPVIVPAASRKQVEAIVEVFHVHAVVP